MEVQQQQIDALQENLVFMKKKVASGSATNFDALTTQVKVAEAQNQKIELENMLNKQEIELCRLTGICGVSEVVLKGNFPSETLELNESKSINEALDHRLEMQIAKAQEKKALELYNNACTDRNPSLDINVLYGEKNGFFIDIQEIQPAFTGNVALTMPIFTGLRTLNQIKEAKANLKSASYKKKEVEDNISAEVRQAVSDVRASIEKIKVTELDVKLAQEAVVQARVRYKGGVITNLDLLNAEISLAQSRLLHLQALHDYALYVDALKKTEGIRLWSFEE